MPTRAERVVELAGFAANLSDPAIWGELDMLLERHVNTASPKLVDYLYKQPPDGWGFEPRYIKVGGKNTTRLARDVDALLSLIRHNKGDRRLELCLRLSDLLTQLKTLGCTLDTDGRIRYSGNITGTECVAGDTYIFTRSGYRKIREVVESPRPIQVWTGYGFFQPAARVNYRDVDGFQIKTEHGFVLQGTGNHRLMTPHGWCKLEDLKKGDLIQFATKLPATAGGIKLPHFTPPASQTAWPMHVPAILTAQLAEFAGMWLADGNLNDGDSPGVSLSNGDGFVRRRFASLGRSLFGLRARHYHSPTRCSRVDLHSLWLLHWMRQMKLEGHACQKEIPDWLMGAKETEHRALLRGLTLDSHPGNNCWYYGTQSPVMRCQIQLLLQRLEIISTVGGNKLKLSRLWLGDFANKVGVIPLRKKWELSNVLNRFAECVHGRHHRRLWVKVKAVSKWRGDVFDISMPVGAPPCYVASGLFSHNTQRHAVHKSNTGSGYNLHTVTSGHKHLFLPDEGHWMFSVDLSGSDGWCIGAETAAFGDTRMLTDLQNGFKPALAVCLLFQHGIEVNKWDYPKLLEEAKKVDKNGWLYMACKISIWAICYSVGAQKLIDMIASVSYGMSGTPLYVDVSVVRMMQQAVHARYPGILRRQQRINMLLERDGFLEFANGSRREFLGNVRDAAVQREAYSAHPQVTTTWISSLAWHRLWYDPENIRADGSHVVQPLLLVHDSIMGQFPKDRTEWACQKIRSWFNHPVTIAGSTVTVPFSGNYGESWAHASGLAGYSPAGRV